jgi:hypothetical protein
MDLSSGSAVQRQVPRPSAAAVLPDRHSAPAYSKDFAMTIHSLALTPLISLIAGVLILAMPRLLNYIVALYLIVVGLLGLFPHLAG